MPAPTYATNRSQNVVDSDDTVSLNVDSLTSYSFADDACVVNAAQNFWYYKQGHESLMDERHEILVIPMTFMDTRYRVRVPSAFPVISES